MAESTPRKINRLLWPVVIALLAILTVIWWFSPSGDREGAVEDPIVTGELADPAAEEGAGTLGEGLPGEDAPDPAGDEPVPSDGEASADRLPAEAVEVPNPPPAQ